MFIDKISFKFEFNGMFNIEKNMITNNNLSYCKDEE